MEYSYTSSTVGCRRNEGVLFFHELDEIQAPDYGGPGCVKVTTVRDHEDGATMIEMSVLYRGARQRDSEAKEGAGVAMTSDAAHELVQVLQAAIGLSVSL